MDSLSIKRLKDTFAGLRADGVVRSQLVVKDMSRAAHGVFLEADPRNMRMAFILSSVLWDIAEAFWEGPVKEDDVYAAWRVMSQPVIRAVDFIAGLETDENAVSNALLLSFARVYADRSFTKYS